MATLAFKTTNNEVKYKALVARLSAAKVLGATEVEVNSNLQMVVNQVLGMYVTKGENLKK